MLSNYITISYHNTVIIINIITFWATSVIIFFPKKKTRTTLKLSDTFSKYRHLYVFKPFRSFGYRWRCVVSVSLTYVCPYTHQWPCCTRISLALRRSRTFSGSETRLLQRITCPRMRPKNGILGTIRSDSVAVHAIMIISVYKSIFPNTILFLYCSRWLMNFLKI